MCVRLTEQKLFSHMFKFRHLTALLPRKKNIIIEVLTFNETSRLIVEIYLSQFYEELTIAPATDILNFNFSQTFAKKLVRNLFKIESA
jgi:hypothetical protein